ncbi:MAG: SCO family protein [Bacteroidia bacterium]
MKKISFLILIAGISLFTSCGNKKEETKSPLLLPVYGTKTVYPKNLTDTVYHTIADFSFTDQYKEPFTQRNTAGKIYIANFFFATCQSICPVMTTQLTRVQKEVLNDKDILILSHTVNPSHDTAEVLLQFANKYGAVKDKWFFLTGPKKAIYDLAKNSYLVNAVEDDGTAEGFIHSETFLLIDKQKRIRGVYDGTDSLQVDKLMGDIKTLKKEK